MHKDSFQLPGPFSYLKQCIRFLLRPFGLVFCHLGSKAPGTLDADQE